MVLLYLVAALAFFVWWVRGSFIPALAIVLSMLVLEYGAYIDQKRLDPPVTLVFIFIVSTAAFIPYLVKRHRARRFDRMVNGVTFLGKD